MVLSKRERFISIAVIAAVAALLLNTLLLGPYLDWRSSLVAQSKTQAAALNDAHTALAKEQQLRKTLAGMDASMKSDTSAAEGQLHHLVHDWEQQATVTNASFERVRTADEHGFIRLTYHVSAEGKTGALAMLLYRIETAAIPIRIDDIVVSTKADNSDDLKLNLSISSLCQSSNLPRPTAATANETAGGWQ
jgi:Type II secretion system (T2SS), protein M subtype b